MTATAAAKQVQRSLGDRLSVTSWPAASLLAAALVVAPIGFLAVSILNPNVEVWRQQWQTRLPGQLVETAVMLVGVGVGALVVGGGLAWLVTAYRFPGSRLFAWLLVAPLAMPGYILGFVTLSVIGFTGPIQGWWRDVFGQDAWFPPVRSLGGAVVVFTLVLYPYVFLLTRAALGSQAGAAYEVARSLGAGQFEAAWRVALPLCRPALAGGVAVVMMETLTDFATVQYFGVDTISVGVFRIWRGTFDRDSASEFATMVLVVALLIIGLERALRGRARFGQAAGRAGGIVAQPLAGLGGLAATGLCIMVLMAAIGGPAIQLAVWAVGEATGPRGTPLLNRFIDFLGNSLILAAMTLAVCVAVAVIVANAARFSRSRAARLAARLTAVGYAVPGPVVAIGVVLALVALDQLLDRIGLGLPGAVATGSLVGLIYAYSIRFLAPGLQAVESGLDQVPEELTSSARSLGAAPGSVVRTVHLPLGRVSLMSAAILVGVDALKELPIVLLLRPIGFDTLSVWTFNLASESRFEQAALPAISIIVVALIPVGILSRRLAGESR